MYLNRMTMTYKANNAVKRHLKEQWEAVCNGYLLELANMWEWDCKSYGFWVGDDVGGIFSYGDDTFINMDEIIFCVENDVAYETYYDYMEYCTWAHEFGFNVPNFESYFKGCPIAPKDVQERLTKQKQELDKLIREEKEKLKNNAQSNPF